MDNFGVVSKGVKCPVIREGDNIVDVVVESVLEATARDYDQMSFGGRAHELGGYLNYKNDIICVTESVVARSAGLYVTVDEIAEDIREKFGENPEITLMKPIYSRNRFSMILKGIARAARKITILMPEFDEVGNPRGVNQFTGVNIQEYYTEICHKENCFCVIMDYNVKEVKRWGKNWIFCGLHDYQIWGRHPYMQEITCYKLSEICAYKNPDFGLLGSNKATEERLKLFPTIRLANKVCADIKEKIRKTTGKDVIVCCYGDGCFKDPLGGIWEFADPVTMPGYTDEELMESTPNEIKFKAFIDESKSNEELEANINAAKEEKNLVGKMSAMGTTPRLFRDLIASFADLTSGSGNRQTPVVLIQGYFD